MAKTTKKKNVEEKPNYPEYGYTVTDSYDVDTKLTVCSNNGSDLKKTLHYARSKRMSKPILIDIDCDVPSYNITNFSLTVDEAKSMIDELQRMVEYLEEI